MRFAAKTTVLLFTLAYAVGCSLTHPSAAQQETVPAIAALKRRLAERGLITFRSCNGIAYRMDGDTEFIFYPNGDACMLEWGLSGTAYRGNYHAYSDGRLLSSFKDFQYEWPAMTVEQDGTSLLLRPLYPSNQYPPTPDSWPFRMLTGDDEIKVLNTAKAWLADAPPTSSASPAAR